MSTKYLNLKTEQLIEAVRSGNARAKQMVFNQFAPAMLGICRRYLRSEQDAEDALLIGFARVFDKLHTLQNNDQFPAWTKRIMINQCLMMLRKKQIDTTEIGPMVAQQLATNETAIDELAYADILELLDTLPEGYRTVFNLYVVEGYKHKEIAELMNISINTSKSQLIMARKKLQALLMERASKEHPPKNESYENHG